MKGMKGKMMKKLKSANKTIGYLTPDRILQVRNFDEFVENIKSKSNLVDKFPFKAKPEKPDKCEGNEVKKDLEEEKIYQEIVLLSGIDDKENIYSSKYHDLSEIDVDSFRKPDMDSGSLFDPKLLEAFRFAVSECIRLHEATETAAQVKTFQNQHKYPFFESELSSESDNQPDPLIEFPDKRPPGGDDSVVFYTTSLRGIRKTFEDCQSIRFLLQSFGVVYYERDVSVHSEYRDELWRVMGERVLPPRLFIRGRYIGDAEKVLTLHEQGRLRVLFRDIPIDFSEGPCNMCCGLRFMLCYSCNGSRKVFENGGGGGGGGGDGGVWSKCLQCNENGLVVCPLC